MHLDPKFFCLTKKYELLLIMSLRIVVIAFKKIKLKTNHNFNKEICMRGEDLDYHFSYTVFS